MDVSAGRSKKRDLMSKINAANDKIGDDFKKRTLDAAYFDGETSDADILLNVKLFKQAMADLMLPEVEPYTTLEAINFTALKKLIDEEDEQYLKNTGKAKKRSIEDRKLFFEKNVTPILCERYAIVDKSLYFKELWGYWRKVGSAEEIDIIVKIAGYMIPQLNITSASNILSGAVESVVSIIGRSRPSTSSQIQFNDCVFDPASGMSQETPSSFPRFIFNVDVWDDVANGVDEVGEVDDLLLHLSNGDEETKRCLIDRLSMAFITDAKMKVKLDSKAVIFFGASGKNGKSTFVDLLSRAFNRECVQESFELSSFEGVNLVSLKSNLLFICPDASGVHVQANVAASVKMAVTSDPISVKALYKMPETVIPLAQIVICSNSMPKAEDKSRGWDRRLEWYEVKEKLERDDAWFRAIRSERASRYLRYILLKNAEKLIKQDGPIIPSPQVVESSKGYDELNRNVSAWLSARADETNATPQAFINRMPSAKMFEDYQKWCEDNGEISLQIGNFNSIVAAETNAKRKMVTLYKGTDKEAFEWWQVTSNAKDKLLATTAYVKCWVVE